MFGIKKACSRWLARQAHQQRQIVVNRLGEIEMAMMRELGEVRKELATLRDRVEKLEQGKAPID